MIAGPVRVSPGRIPARSYSPVRCHRPSVNISTVATGARAPSLDGCSTAWPPAAPAAPTASTDTASMTIGLSMVNA